MRQAIENKKLIVLKGFLFLLAGVLASFLLLLDKFSWRDFLLLLIAVWAFCRFYYFMFYVIEKYVDAEYKFSGIGSFILYFWRHKNR